MNITSLTCDVAVVGGGPGGIPAALPLRAAAQKSFSLSATDTLAATWSWACLCWVISTRTAVRSLVALPRSLSTKWSFLATAGGMNAAPCTIPSPLFTLSTSS